MGMTSGGGKVKIKDELEQARSPGEDIESVSIRGINDCAEFKLFDCAVSGKQCSHGRYLTQHMRIQTLEKSFHFSLCDKQFSCLGKLCLHMRTHTGDKQFNCAICIRSSSPHKLHYQR